MNYFWVQQKNLDDWFAVWSDIYQGPSNFITVDNLVEGGTYAYRIRAGSKAGQSEWSTDYSWHTDSSDSKGELTPPLTLLVPDDPDPPRLIGSSNTWLSVTWKEPNDNGASVMGYDLQVWNGKAWDSIFKGVQYHHNVSGLLGETTYSFRVRAQNSRGYGNFSLAAKFNTGRADPPSRPEPPFLISANSSSITLAWDAPSNNGAYIRGYEVKRDGDDVYSGTDLQLFDNELNPGELHQYSVRAQNKEGWSDWSRTSALSTTGRCGSESDLKILSTDWIQASLHECDTSCWGFKECTTECLMVKPSLASLTPRRERHPSPTSAPAASEQTLPAQASTAGKSALQERAPTAAHAQKSTA